MKTEVSINECLQIDATLDQIDQNGKYTRAVTAKITSNKFELIFPIAGVTKFQEKVKEEYAKSITFDLKTLEIMPYKETKVFFDGFEEYLNNHEGYIKHLNKKVEIDFEPILLKDLANCEYKPSLMFLLKNKIFFKELKTTAKKEA
jgi:hypothetical protein